MGMPMARRLLAAGHQVTAWNRTRARAEALAAEGAQIASSPVDAAQASDVVMSMLFDDAANEAVMFGPNGAIEALKPGALHILLSTISMDLSDRLAQEHARRRQLFLAAPVFGRPIVAQEGRLWIVAAGSNDAVAIGRPLLASLAKGVSVVGSEPRQAHAVKLGGNFLIGAMIHSLGEAFAYAAAQGIEPGAFLDTVNSALFQSPLYTAYAQVMLYPPERPGATIELGLKDLRLLREAAASRNTNLSLADHITEILDVAQKSGRSDEDWAVAQYRLAKQRSAMRN
jgi:3-hydroxyisobutyrate dehydrogenase-like beta-hydroxyacid dehydrogenase